MKINSCVFLFAIFFPTIVMAGANKSSPDGYALNCDNAVVEAFHNFHASVVSSVELGNAFDAMSTVWLTSFFSKHIPDKKERNLEISRAILFVMQNATYISDISEYSVECTNKVSRLTLKIVNPDKKITRAVINFSNEDGQWKVVSILFSNDLIDRENGPYKKWQYQ